MPRHPPSRRLRVRARAGDRASAGPRRLVLRRDRRSARGMLRTQVEDALAELVALGLVHSDSFAGLRALLTPSDRRKPLGGGKRRRAHARSSASRMRAAGRSSAPAPLVPAAQRTGPTTRSSSTSPIRCCAATASCSGGCSSARRRGFRRGASCCACCAGWRRAAKYAAAGSSPASRASSSRCPRPSISCARRGVRRVSRSLDLVERGRSAQPRRQYRAGPEGARGHQQPRAVSQRHRRSRRSSPAKSSGSASSSRESAPRPRALSSSGKRDRRCSRTCASVEGQDGTSLRAS